MLALGERVAGIGPATCPWEGHILPLYYTRATRQLLLAREILLSLLSGGHASSGLSFELGKWIVH